MEAVVRARKIRRRSWTGITRGACAHGCLRYGQVWLTRVQVEGVYRQKGRSLTPLTVLFDVYTKFEQEDYIGLRRWLDIICSS